MLFSLGPVSIHWYGLMMALSFIIGSYLLIKNGVKKGINEEALWALCVFVIIGGVVGARLIYVLTNLADFAHDPLEAIRIDRGGLAFHGGLLGGLAAAWITAVRYRTRMGNLLDLAVPGICIGYALVRVANIFNQEILGRPAAALFFERHPAQVYGSLIGLACLLFYHHLARKKHMQPGMLFWWFVIYYSLLRGLIEETFRENPLYLWGYVSEAWGFGFFTLTHLATPFILLLAFWMLRKMPREKWH